MASKNGAPDRIRTCDPSLRRAGILRKVLINNMMRWHPQRFCASQGMSRHSVPHKFRTTNLCKTPFTDTPTNRKMPARVPLSLSRIVPASPVPSNIRLANTVRRKDPRTGGAQLSSPGTCCHFLSSPATSCHTSPGRMSSIAKDALMDINTPIVAVAAASARV